MARLHIIITLLSKYSALPRCPPAAASGPGLRLNGKDFIDNRALEDKEGMSNRFLGHSFDDGGMEPHSTKYKIKILYLFT